ncbi:hypothetical protein LUZ60_009416 [Juncus effusus]|nr:hypothetical protein LUZ60_009416 [Juncus effusus]
MVYGVQKIPSDVIIHIRFVFCRLTNEEQRTLIALEILRFNDIIILNCTENMNYGKTYAFFSSLPNILPQKYDYVMKVGTEDKLVEKWLTMGKKGKNRVTEKPGMYDFPGTNSKCSHKLIPDTVAVHRLKRWDRWLMVLKYFNMTRVLVSSILLPLPEREEKRTKQKSMEMLCSSEATKYIWKGSIPLQIQLHESEITSLPSPPPLLTLGPRIGYLPLLIPPLKAHFSSTLPPGTDNIWFDYKGLPLKWHIPTGVLFDLLCAEPERPWNLTVHFRGSPGDVLTPLEGEESLKWNYINSLKEAAYIINGNSKSIMNMSQADQYDIWQSLMKGNMEGYTMISSRLKLGPFGDDSSNSDESESTSNKACRIPVRLYARFIEDGIDELEAVPAVDTWDKIWYINRPFEIFKEEGGYVTLKQAMKSLMPEIFDKETRVDQNSASEKDCLEDQNAKLKIIRVQGIELDMDIPFFWVANCLKNPDFYLHVCVLVSKQA